MYVHVYNSVHWTISFLQGTRKIRPILTGHPVLIPTHRVEQKIYSTRRADDLSNYSKNGTLFSALRCTAQLLSLAKQVGLFPKI